MNDIQIFNNPDFGEIRTIIIDGEPWFVSADVSKSLGYARTSNMIKLVDDEDKKNISSSDLEQQVYKQNYTIGIINESGLYAAIFGSKQENAKKFKKWVTSEVLPSIRKTGTYGQPQLPQTTDGKIALLAQGHTELKAEVDELKADLESLKMDLPILPIEAEKITNATRAKGVSVMGGKGSNAYANRSIVNAVYRDIYSQIYRNFGVKSYKAIKRSQTDKVITVIEEYKPPVVLQDRIDSENAQQSLDLRGGVVK